MRIRILERVRGKTATAVRRHGLDFHNFFPQQITEFIRSRIELCVGFDKNHGVLFAELIFELSSTSRAVPCSLFGLSFVFVGNRSQAFKVYAIIFDFSGSSFLAFDLVQLLREGLFIMTPPQPDPTSFKNGISVGCDQSKTRYLQSCST